MKLTMDQIEAKMTAAWGRQALVVPHRICGNRYTYVVTDHHEHWLALLKSWVGGRIVFEPVGARWPEDPWPDAVLEAVELAHAYFKNEGNTAAVTRLARAETIALVRNWSQLGDDLDTYLIASQSKGGVIYRVNGRCDCPDWLHNGVPGGWCKHRIARALAKRATEILKNGDGAESGQDSSAPKAPCSEEPVKDQNTTDRPARQIELLVLYEADGAGAFARIHSDGKLLEFKAGGQVTEAPSKDLNALYRWLQDQGYTADMTQFQWLDRNQGHRRRRQVYVLDEAAKRVQALPVQHSRGRAKLFKQ
jgi:hypothetical protein